MIGPDRPPRRGFGTGRSSAPAAPPTALSFKGRGDRPLKPEAAELPGIAVRSPGRHPLIYRKMVLGPAGGRAESGDMVRVVDRDGRPLGYGLWNARSQIAVRLIAPGATEPPGAEFWRAKLAEAAGLRARLPGLADVSDACRLVHAEGDGLSGLIVDQYGEVLSAEAFSLGIYQRSSTLLGLLAELVGAKHWRIAVDARIAEAEAFPGDPLATPSLPAAVTIRENGVRYRVRFEGAHKTGFFCDQRDNRRDLAAYCEGRSVLDLCCYTGGFGVAALARGGASDATCVDLDEAALAVARENANLNEVRPTLVQADAFGYLRQMVSNGRRFGVVVLDPPKLIPTRDDWDEGRAKYFDLNTLAIGRVEPGGILLTCSCSGLLPPAEFVEILQAAARRAGRRARLLGLTGAGPDHPVALDAPEGAYLKAAWLMVGEFDGPPA